MYFVYVLFSNKDKRLYIGYTNNLKKRLTEHQSGKSIATRSRLPVKLVYYECYLRWSDAKRREKYLKGGNGRAQLKVQLQDILNDLDYSFRNKHLV